MLPGSRVGDRAVLVHSKGCCAAGCTRLCSITKALQHLQCSCFRLRLVPCTVSVYTLESFNSQDHSQNVCYILLRLQLLPYLLHLPNVSGRTPQSRVSETSWDCCILAYLTLQDKSKRALRESGSQSHKDRVHTQNERNEIRSKKKKDIRAGKHSCGEWVTHTHTHKAILWYLTENLVVINRNFLK